MFASKKDNYADLDKVIRNGVSFESFVSSLITRSSNSSHFIDFFINKPASTEVSLESQSHVLNLNRKKAYEVKLTAPTFSQTDSNSLDNSQNNSSLICSNLRDITQVENSCHSIPIELTNESLILSESNGTVDSVPTNPLNSESANSLNTFVQRGKKKCPYCKAIVFALPRHLKGKPHYMSAEEASAIVGLYGLREKKKSADETKTETSIKTKSYHRKRHCPISSCLKVVLHLNEHLLKVHKLPKNAEYYKLLKEAKIYDEDFPQTFGEKISPEMNFPKKSAVEIDTNFFSSFENDQPIRSNIEKIYNQKINNEKISENILKNEKSIVCLEIETKKYLTRVKKVNYENNDSDVSDISQSDDSDYKPEEILEKKCSPFIENLFAKFLSFMIGPDRARKEHSVQNVVGNVRRIFEIIGIDNDLRNIFLDIKKSVLDNYLMKYCVERGTKPGAIKTYLYSLKDFCDFLLTENIVLEGISKEHVSEASMKLEQWRKKYKAQDKVQKHTRAADDFEMLITPEQVRIYEESVMANQARSLLKLLLEKNLLLSQAEYCCVRDHLITVILFSNAPRSGVVARLTVQEFEKAVVTGNRAVISVKDHKTYASYGLAKLLIVDEHYIWLKTFIDKCRNNLPVQCDKVFLSWTGRALTPGDISKRLHTLWAKCGIFNGRSIPKNLSTNIVRKSASTNLREADSKYLNEAAFAMMHSKRTADEHYAIPNMAKCVKSGLEEIRKQFYSYTSNDKECENEGKLSQATLKLSVDSCINSNLELPSISNNERNEKIEESVKLKSDVVSTPSKKIWLANETQILKDVFPNGSPSIKTIEQVHSSLNIDASPLQIYNKMKSLQRYSPDKKESKRMLFQRSRSCKWKDHHIDILRTIGAELISGRSLCSSKIEDLLKGTAVWSDFSITQIRTRVKHEKDLHEKAQLQLK